MANCALFLPNWTRASDLEVVLASTPGTAPSFGSLKTRFGTFSLTLELAPAPYGMARSRALTQCLDDQNLACETAMDFKTVESATTPLSATRANASRSRKSLEHERCPHF